MAGTAMALFNQEIFFTPDATAQHSYAYVNCPALDGKGIELAVYVWFSHGSSAGKIQIQSAPFHDYPASNAWANEGNTIDWAAEDSVKVGRLTGLFGALRCDINTAVTSGTVRVFVKISAVN